MSQLMFSHNQAVRRESQVRVEAYTRTGQYALMFALFLIICVLSFIYLARFSSTATKGYEITRLEIERNKLTGATEVLNVKIAQERSLQSLLKEDSRIAHMIQGNNPEYFYAGSSLAKR